MSDVSSCKAARVLAIFAFQQRWNDVGPWRGGHESLAKFLMWWAKESAVGLFPLPTSC